MPQLVLDEPINKPRLILDEESTSIPKKPKLVLDEEKPKSSFINKYAKYLAINNIVGSQVAKKAIETIDKPVEEIAKFVEPKKPSLLGFPRQMAAEAIRMYKPSTVATTYIGGKVLSPILKPVGKFIASKTPEGLKTLLKKEFTIGKGQPLAYQEAKKATQLEKLAGGREAEQVAKTLTTKPTGEALSREEQKYVGRIFRKEIDLGGKVSRISESPEISEQIAKNIEVEIAFNPKVKQLQDDLVLVGKALQNKEILAKGLVGKKFRTETGFIEKATEVSKIAKIKPSGKPSTKRFDIGLVSEPVAPLKGNIPSELLEKGESIIRGVKQISQAPSTNKFINLSRKDLLHKKNILKNQLNKEVKNIEIGVRSNYDIFDRTFSEQLRTHPKFQELSSIAEEGRTIMDKWSKALAQSGIPKEQSKKVIEENVGQYMARMYSSKLQPQAKGFGLFKDLRLKLNGLKHRKDLSENVLKAMGEIKEPALPTAIRVKEISSSIANNKLFNIVSKNSEWSAVENATGKMIQMPDTPALGALKGKWVIPEIAEDINQITKATEYGWKLYNQALSAWKYGKVVLNPAAQVRNMISNTILLDLSGVNHLRQAQLFPKVFKEYLSKGKIYQQALEDGAIGGEFVGSEVAKLRDSYLLNQGGNLEKWINIIKFPFKKADKIYNGVEQSAKLLKYIDVLEKGGTRQLAAKEAQKWLFDYREVPKFIEQMKQVSPFITFSYKSLPRIAETITTNPLKIYKYYAMFNAWNEAARKQIGMSKEEYEKQQKNLPDWMLRNIGGVPANLMMPWKDKQGLPQLLNLEYILPVGMSTEIMQKGLGGGKGMAGLLESPLVSNPFYQIVADLQKNKDFRGKPIIPIGATNMEANKLAIEYIYRQLAPSLAPALGEIKGGYSWEKLMAAIQKRPNQYTGVLRDIPTTVLDVLAGIKITPVDTQQNIRFNLIEKKKKLDDLSYQVMNVMRDKGISSEEKNKRRQELLEKRKRVLKE